LSSTVRESMAGRLDGQPFDASKYWAKRLHRSASLEATGTLPFDGRYQQWLYRLKEAAIHRALRPWRDRLRGASVLNVGCGGGYFEPFFAACGASQLMGVDFVASAVERLQADRPEFEYAVADLSQPLPPSLVGRSFDLVTAIDVLYHIVDDNLFARALENLCSLCRPDGGMLLWTDAPGRVTEQNATHCRYREPADYSRILAKRELSLARSTPMYCCFDVYTSWSERFARYPRLTYRAMYAFDRLFATRNWRRTTNHCFVAVHGQTGGMPR